MVKKIGAKIQVIYSGRLNRTRFVCGLCRKQWAFKGTEKQLSAADRLFLLNHDRSHS